MVDDDIILTQKIGIFTALMFTNSKAKSSFFF